MKSLIKLLVKSLRFYIFILIKLCWYIQILNYYLNIYYWYMQTEAIYILSIMHIVNIK